MNSGEREPSIYRDWLEAANARVPAQLAKLRAAGWMVAVHNDYHQDGKLMTFWLFTRAGIARVVEQIHGRDR